MSQAKPETKLCRFDLFVRLKPENVTRYPNNSLTWCHRGDKFSTNEDAMLPLLVKMLSKHHHAWKLAIIRDNLLQKTDPAREVVKLYNGVIEINRLSDYSYMMTKVILPAWLK